VHKNNENRVLAVKKPKSLHKIVSNFR